MDLIPYQPFRDLEKMFDKLAEDFHDVQSKDFASIIEPKMDIYETKNDIVTEIEMPGIDPESLNVFIEGDVLKVEGRKEETKEERKKGYFKKEIKSGYLRRMASLPSEVKADKAKAEFENGILKIEIPKAKETKAKKKDIKVKYKK
jgi:HSP20 family protein